MNFIISYGRPNYTFVVQSFNLFNGKTFLESKKLRLEDKCNYVKINRIMTTIN